MQKGEIKIEFSSALDNLFFQYTHLPIGGKQIPCPYWMNRLKAGILGPFGGKGTPQQIVQATLSAAQEEKIDLSKLSTEEILKLMSKHHIGVDCSGFVYWMLDAFDRERGGNGIADDIFCPDPPLKPTRANVATLASPQSVVPVDLKEVKVGDVLLLNKGRHIAIITRVFREGEIIKKIEYAHSSSKTEIKGVHKATVQINNPSLSLKEQKWEEKDKKGKSYSKTNFFGEKDGLYRLKSFLKFTSLPQEGQPAEDQWK